MKWFQMDTNAPGSPTWRAVKRRLGNEGIGALVSLWCYVGERGRKEPGRAVNADNQPFDLEDLIDASGLTTEKFDTLIDTLLEKDHIDARAWHERKELSFPGMLSRAQEYVRKKMKAAGESPVNDRRDAGDAPPTRQDSTAPDLTDEDVENLILFPAPPTEDQQVDAFVVEWNTMAAEAKLTKCQAVTPNRKKHIKARLKERSLADFRDVFARVATSRFCCGQNDRGWKASIDWIISSADVPVKVLEGKYDSTRGTAPVGSRTGVADGSKYAGVTLR